MYSGGCVELSLGTRVGTVHEEWPGLATKVGPTVATEKEPQKG